VKKDIKKRQVNNSRYRVTSMLKKASNILGLEVKGLSSLSTIVTTAT
jgi:hypothetical protein